MILSTGPTRAKGDSAITSAGAPVNADGTFEIRGLAPGRYTLGVGGRGKSGEGACGERLRARRRVDPPHRSKALAQAVLGPHERGRCDCRVVDEHLGQTQPSRLFDDDCRIEQTISLGKRWVGSEPRHGGVDDQHGTTHVTKRASGVSSAVTTMTGAGSRTP